MWRLMMIGLLLAKPSLGEEVYRYDRSTKASDFAQSIFGKPGSYQRIPEIDMGRVSVGASSSLDCGSINLTANLNAEFNNLQKQIKELIPKSADDGIKLAQRGAMMALCYAYPTACAEIRHNFLAMQANLNLRTQACRAIDDFIDSSADKGAKQLKAEAKAKCVADNGGDFSKCNDVTGLALRDFQSGLEKKFTTGKQEVLKAIVGFSQERDPHTYEFLAGILGEIEVQGDGYWQPVFAKGMIRPNDMAANVLAVAENKACGDKLLELINGRGRGGSLVEGAVDGVIARKLVPEDAKNISDLNEQDRKLACAALGRSLGQVAAKSAAAKAEAVLASGLLNSAIPNSLRDEYRARGNGAFEALKKSLESDQIPPVEEVRRSIAELAQATREKNRLLAAQISAGRLENYRYQSQHVNDCVDTLSCGGGS